MIVSHNLGHSHERSDVPEKGITTQVVGVLGVSPDKR